jgi:hypothetical protein
LTDRVVIRSGSGATPPVAMLPGELAYTPEDGLLWLGGFGAGRPVRSGGASLSEVNAAIAANAPGFQTVSEVSAAIVANAPGFQTASQVNAAIVANAPGFQTASQVSTTVVNALAGPLVFDGGTF